MPWRSIVSSGMVSIATNILLQACCTVSGNCNTSMRQ